MRWHEHPIFQTVTMFAVMAVVVGVQNVYVSQLFPSSTNTQSGIFPQSALVKVGAATLNGDQGGGTTNTGLGGGAAGGSSAATSCPYDSGQSIQLGDTETNAANADVRWPISTQRHEYDMFNPSYFKLEPITDASVLSLTSSDGGSTDAKVKNMMGSMFGFKPSRLVNAYNVAYASTALQGNDTRIKGDAPVLEVAVDPSNPVVRAPSIGYDLGGGYVAMVVFAASDRLTLHVGRHEYITSTKTCADGKPCRGGYWIYVKNICVDQKIQDAYNGVKGAQESAGANLNKIQLPMVRPGQTLGKAVSGSVIVGVRDSGPFITTSKPFYWEGAPAQNFTASAGSGSTTGGSTTGGTAGSTAGGTIGPGSQTPQMPSAETNTLSANYQNTFSGNKYTFSVLSDTDMRLRGINDQQVSVCSALTAAASEGIVPRVGTVNAKSFKKLAKDCEFELIMPATFAYTQRLPLQFDFTRAPAQSVMVTVNIVGLSGSPDSVLPSGGVKAQPIFEFETQDTYIKDESGYNYYYFSLPPVHSDWTNGINPDGGPPDICALMNVAVLSSGIRPISDLGPRIRNVFGVDSANCKFKLLAYRRVSADKTESNISELNIGIPFEVQIKDNAPIHITGSPPINIKLIMKQPVNTQSYAYVQVTGKSKLEITVPKADCDKVPQHMYCKLKKLRPSDVGPEFLDYTYTGNETPTSKIFRRRGKTVVKNTIERNDTLTVVFTATFKEFEESNGGHPWYVQLLFFSEGNGETTVYQVDQG